MAPYTDPERWRPLKESATDWPLNRQPAAQRPIRRAARNEVAEIYPRLGTWRRLLTGVKVVRENRSTVQKNYHLSTYYFRISVGRSESQIRCELEASYCRKQETAAMTRQGSETAGPAINRSYLFRSESAFEGFLGEAYQKRIERFVGIG